MVNKLLMNGIRTTSVALVVIFFTGCGGYFYPSQIIGKEMDDRVGLPISVVFDRLGIPDSEDEVAGRKFYVWNNELSGVNIVYSTSSSPIFNLWGADWHNSNQNKNLDGKNPHHCQH